MKEPPHWALRMAIPALSWCTARYIASHRRKFWNVSKRLSPAQQSKLAEFFPEFLLTETRIAHSEIPNPWFASLAGAFGIADLPDSTNIGAITFVDLIVYPAHLPIETLFHEMVHVVQYRALGLKRFARLYVAGVLRTGAYITIPLEVQAYELESRFRDNPQRRLSVLEDVERRLKAGLFD